MHVYGYLVWSALSFCFLVRSYQGEHAQNDCRRPTVVRPRPDALTAHRRWPIFFGVPNGRTTACSTRRAFPPPRGRRAASQLAPCAGHACSASRTTLHKLRHAGSRWRAASKLQATDAICSPRCMEFNQRDFRRAARVPRSCRDVYFDISIDIPHASACLLHLRWTRRRHDLDQSNPVLRRCGPAVTSSLKSMEQIKSF